MKTFIILLLVIVAECNFAGQEQLPNAPALRDLSSGDWREIIKSADTMATNSLYRVLAQTLKQSKVPTAEEAEHKSWPLVPNANRSTGVTALFRLATPVKDIGASGDFVWEVRVLEGEELTDIIWVGASTGNAKSVFPK